ncbi:MAG: hypothetical protein LBU48_01990 [Coriobacteriales bacterium]|jgi:hypothetical protein|nr:hypothetical protein [Coriobacteriales bacterium]
MGLTGEFLEFYRTANMREGILCWYPFEHDAHVLDLSGGVLTDLLGTRAVQLHTEHTSGTKYDYVVALDPPDMRTEALCAYAHMLKPQARLLLAYENPFALRYWAGHSAPDSGQPYDTLFGRGKNPLPSKAELQQRLERAGFLGQKWYYPLADHWLTTEVYSDSYLPNELLKQRFVPYIDNDASLHYDERGLYREIVRGGAFEFMCGAYLVEAQINKEDPPCDVEYAAVTAYREPGKRFATLLKTDGRVYKTPLDKSGKMTVRQIAANHAELRRCGVNAVECVVENDVLVMPRIELPTLGDHWVDSLLRGSWNDDEVVRLFDRIRDDIHRAARGGRCYWEMVPDNCFYDVSTDELTYFDQEYYADDRDPDFAVARAVGVLKFSAVLSKDPHVQALYDSILKRYTLADEFKAIAATTYAEVYGEEHERYQQIIRQNAAALAKRRL